MAFDPSTVQKEQAPPPAFDPSSASADPGDFPSWGRTIGDIGAGLAQGVLDLPEGAGQIAEHLGIPVSKAIPGVVQRGAEALKQRAQSSTAGQVAEFAGGVLPFLLQPELGIGEAAGAIPWIGRVAKPLTQVFTRSTMPAVLQPTDPNTKDFWSEKGLQALVGTGLGEALQGVSRLFGLPGKGFAKSDKEAADAAQKAKDVAAQNQRVQQAVDTLNQRNTLQHRGAQVAAIAQQAAQEDIPRRTTLGMYQRIYNQMGIPNEAPKAINFQTAAKTLKTAGERLNAIHERMMVDGTNPELQEKILSIWREGQKKLVGKSRAVQEDWDSTVGQLAIDPLFRQPTFGGKDLANWMTSLRGRIQQLGLDSQGGGENASAFRDMAASLRDVLHTVEDEADRLEPGVGAERRSANLAYQLSRRMVEATKASKGGVATPADIINAMEAAEGDIRYGADTRLTRLKTQLDQARVAHETPVDTPKAPVTVKGPQPLKAPDPTTTDPTLGNIAAQAAGHIIGAKTGPLGRSAATALARRVGRKVVEPVARTTSGIARRAGPPASATAGRAVPMGDEDVQILSVEPGPR